MTLAVQQEQISIKVGKTELKAHLCVPESCIGIILFVDGGRSKREWSPNDHVASVLRESRLGALWLDLSVGQTVEPFDVNREEATCRYLDAVCDWLWEYRSIQDDVPVGLYGIHDGAAAVLHLAAVRDDISAVVSRGCYPDKPLQNVLCRIRSPTLLIVGGLDGALIGTNRSVYAALRCKKQFAIIPGATHAFEEPGNVEVVTRLARCWFLQHTYPVTA